MDLSAPPSSDVAARSRALMLAIALLLAVVVADLVTGGSALTVIAVTLLAAVAFALALAQRTLAATARDRAAELDRERVARHHADLLARVGDLLQSPLEPQAMVANITDLLVPGIADVAVVDLLQPDGSLRGAVTSAIDQEVADDLARLRAEHPLDPASDHPVPVALRTGEPQMVRDMSRTVRDYADSEEHVRHVIGFRYNSAIVLPLIAGGRALGTLSFARREGSEPFTEPEVRLARDLAPRAAQALENARLFSELEIAEGRLEAIVANLDEAISAFAPDGTVLFANQAAAELSGYASPAEWQAATDLDAELERWALFDEGGVPIRYEALPVAIALAGGTPEPRVMRMVDRRSGRDAWILARAAPVRDAAGELQFAVVVNEDITAVKRRELRERLLSNASKMMSSSLDADATIAKTAWAAVPELADWARVDLRDERGALVQMAVAHRDIEKLELLEEWRRDYPPSPADDRGPAEVMRTGRPVVWTEVDPGDVERYAQAPRHAEIMREIATCSLVIVPMTVGDQVIGAIQLATTSESGRMLGADELELAEELARRAAIAVEHARVHAIRTHIATTLQRSLLPPRLPVIPGLAIAARFRAVGAATDVGGDFYDLFEGRGGWMVMMGDVTGKGPGAAAITSLARYTMRTVAQYEDDPRAMLARLNATLGADPERRQICTAVCVAVRPPAAGSATGLQIVCAGHPPPLLVGADGSVRPVGRPGTLLGAFPDGRWTLTDVELAAGESLVLYTDGVTDTRRDDGRYGTERLEALLREVGPVDPEAIAGAIDAALLEFGEQRDDVAVLVLSGMADGTALASVRGSAANRPAA